MHNSWLRNVKVLEVSRSASTQFSGWLLAQMGARVVAWRDDSTTFRDTLVPEFSRWLGGGKETLSLELSSEEAPRKLRASASDAQIVLLDDLIYEFPWLRDITKNTDGTTLVITPFGLMGPRHEHAGGDLIASHSSGYSYYLAGARPDLPPMRGPSGQASLFSGLLGAVGVVAWLNSERMPSRHVLDLSEQDANASLLFQELIEYNLERHSRRRDFDGASSAGGLVFFAPTTDGAVIMSPREDHQWQRLLSLIGEPEWAQSEELASGSLRIKNWRVVQELVAEWTGTLSRAQVFALCQSARIACFPVNSLREALNVPVLGERELLSGTGEHDSPSGMPGLPFLATGSGDQTRERAGSERSVGEQPRGLRARELASRANEGVHPLSGVRVLDLSWVVGGPACTRLLALLGAEIVKVETRTRREHLKRLGKDDLLNISKKSITVNLKTDRGIDIIRRLVRQCDVVVENFGFGVTQRLGIDYPILKEDKPDLVMLSMSGLGRSGSGAELVAYGSLLQGYAGWFAEMGQSRPGESVRGQRPMGIRPAWTDQVSAAAGALAIVGALRNRARTGLGSYIDLSMLETLLLTQAEAIALRPVGETEHWRPNASEVACPHGCYPCLGDDEWVAIATYDEDQWSRLRDCLDLPDWTSALDTVALRRQSEEKLDHLITEWTRRRTTADAVALLAGHGIPASRSHSLWSLLDDEHFRARSVFVPLDERRLAIATPWIDSATGRGRCEPAPEVGADTESVLTTVLNLTSEEISQLLLEEVIT